MMHSDYFLEPDWPAPSWIKAYVSLCKSEISTPDELVNKARLQQLLQLPNDPIWIKQIHSAIAIPAIPQNKAKEADATFTQEANQICAVLTADCLPILVCDRQGTTVAAIHAGWRGLAEGVIENTFNQLNLLPENTLVWLGPAISSTKFEVKEDVYAAFTAKDPEATQGFSQISEGKWRADLYALARLRFKKFGVTNFYGGDFCTYSDQDRFFSYRRENKNPGRIVSLVWIDEAPPNMG